MQFRIQAFAGSGSRLFFPPETKKIKEKIFSVDFFLDLPNGFQTSGQATKQRNN
jgi:hypothetical protein